jgi:hypothetical protein
MNSELALIQSSALRAEYVRALDDAVYQIPGFPWPQGRPVISRQELAHAYQVSEDVIRIQAQAHREELESHGYSIIDREQAKEAGLPLNPDYNYPRGVAVYTPAAAVVSGMMLTTSPVTPQIRQWIIGRLQGPTSVAEILKAHGSQLDSIGFHDNGTVRYVRFRRKIVEAPRFDLRTALNELVDRDIAADYLNDQDDKDDYNRTPYRPLMIEKLRRWLSL